MGYYLAVSPGTPVACSAGVAACLSASVNLACKTGFSYTYSSTTLAVTCPATTASPASSVHVQVMMVAAMLVLLALIQ